ncbi:MAG TPA: rod shape-determining protein MreC [Deltaproteobacteria bacterium]|jgi:rod shape-determining protein MreC|nr:rod shape-determining protein MreC [Deltaproteobacteria bacterium]
MRDLLYRIRVPLLFVALVGLTATTMLADRRSLPAGAKDLPLLSGALLDVAVPLQAALSAPFDFVRGLFRRYVALTDLRTENEQLRSRVAQLEEENLQYREALIASERLERIDKMRGEIDLPMLPAEVASRELSPWYRSLLIDRGRANQVHAGMPALTEDGVVGLVTAASPHAARVMLLLDRQSAVDAMVQRSRARGIVRGLGAEELEFEFTAGSGDVEIGDTVITSGLGGVYPKGLRIGEIASLTAEGSHLQQRAKLRPAVDFGRLEELFVVLWRSPTLELLSGDLESPAPAASSGSGPGS